jgi:manganese transport protein
VGSAIALKLLFGLPLVWGVLITAGDVLVLLAITGKAMRSIESLVCILIAIILLSFAAELYAAKVSPPPKP